MTKKSLLLFTAILGLLMSCTKSESAKDVMLKVKDNYNQHTSISYDISLHKKYANEEESETLRANCQLSRVVSDTLVGGHVWFLVDDTSETYYNGNRFYFADRSVKTLIDCEGTEDNAGFIYGTIRGDAIWVGFLEMDRMLAKVSDSSNKVTCVLEGNYYLITVKYPDVDDWSERVETFHVNKENFVIERSSYKNKFQGEYQQGEWSISNIHFDNMSVKDLNLAMEAYKKTYTMQPYPAIEIPLLETGAMAPHFKGIDFTSGKEVSLNNYKGKFVLLDFSYMSCPACIMSIPSLNKIADINKDLIVLCLNSHNNNEKDLQHLPDFIKKNDIRYSMIMTREKTDSLYQVSGYPSLYLINKKGEIVFSEMGFSESLSDSVAQVIKRN